MPTRYLRTTDLARAIGVHANTIRLYEEYGFLSPVPRAANGYRQYTALHLEQARLAHMAARWPYLSDKPLIIDMIKSAASSDLGMAMGGNKGMGFLTDDDNGWGFVLTLMKASETTQGKYPGTFHIGFFVESEDTVDEINRRLKEDGYDVPAPERNNHAYGFYVKAPGGFTVELGA